MNFTGVHCRKYLMFDCWMVNLADVKPEEWKTWDTRKIKEESDGDVDCMLDIQLQQQLGMVLSSEFFVLPIPVHCTLPLHLQGSCHCKYLWQCTRILHTSYQRVCLLPSHLHGVLGHNIHAWSANPRANCLHVDQSSAGLPCIFSVEKVTHEFSVLSCKRNGRSNWKVPQIFFQNRSVSCYQEIVGFDS